MTFFDPFALKLSYTAEAALLQVVVFMLSVELNLSMPPAGITGAWQTVGPGTVNHNTLFMAQPFPE